jgi:hypothetical protein
VGRSESKQVVNQQVAQGNQDQQNAQTSLAGENQAIANAQKSIGQYGRSVWNEFRPGGEFSRNMTTLATSANSGGQNSYSDFLKNQGQMTGSGTTPQMVAASEEADRQGRRSLQSTLLNDEQTRIAGLEGGLQSEAQMMSAVPGMYGSEYSASLGGAGTAGGNAAHAAATPGFWDSFLPALAGGAASVATGFTPHG